MHTRSCLAVAAAVAFFLSPARTEPVVCDAGLLAAEGRMFQPRLGDSPEESASDRCVTSCVTASHVYLYEDTLGILVDPGSSHNDEVLLKADAADELIALYGDRFDFIGFWTTVDPTTRVGGANFRIIFNDATGFGRPLTDDRANLGIDTERLEGFVTMYDFHRTADWDLNITLDHEFGHRWLVYMAPLLDGRVMRRGSHAQPALDIQGGMHGVDWTGSQNPKCKGSPADNTDTGVVWGWLQLYLMGYADPIETETGMSEQRYMDESVDDCPLGAYGGAVSTWTVQDIINSTGPRIPAAGDSRQHWRAGWILIYQPGAPPSSTEIDDIAALLDGYCDHWNAITLGRGTMTQTLFDDCDCSGVPGGGCPGCASDPDCDDEVFCNGAETCDTPTGNCLPGTLPCRPDEICNEAIDLCERCEDQDGDGFGDPASSICPAGPETDCDDADRDVYPAAPEICDGVANDCTSPGWPTVPGDEVDGDADGYVACSPWVGDEPGVVGGGDCDGGDINTYPGAPETNDGTDNQCPGDQGYGIADETSGDSGFHTPGDKNEYCWEAQPGATEYEVVRSESPAFDGFCTGATTPGVCWTDAGVPAVGAAFHYLNRPLSPNLGSWGQDAAGIERTGICP